MAAVFTFDRSQAINDSSYPKATKTVAQMVKALKSTKIPQGQIDLFVQHLAKVDFAPIGRDALGYISGKVVGAPQLKDLKAKPSAMERARRAVVLGPQAKILAAKFDLSVHLKGTDLELHHTDCKGTTKVLFSVPRPARSIA